MKDKPETTRYCSNPTEAWRQELKSSGYDPPALSFRLKLQLLFLSRKWRRILKHTGLDFSKKLNVLEFGCGGGAQLVPLFAKGWTCVGVDCSPDVLNRAQQFVDQLVEAKLLKSDKGSITFKCEDFITYKCDNLFDMTFQFGVLEHFLNDEERVRYLQKMFDLTKPGGFVVSAVPNGEHTFRQLQKTKGLGGYKIPEIDYTVDSIRREMVNCGADSTQVLTHDLMAYKKIQYNKGLSKLINLAIFFIFQIPIAQVMPLSFRRRHAYWLIAIGKKPDETLSNSKQI